MKTLMARQGVAPSVKSAFLDEADPQAVSHAVRDVLERRGALVHEHRHSRVRFDGEPSTRFAWRRQGYVGVYQHGGEKGVEVRLLLRAKWPWRILLAVASVDLAAAVLTIVLNAPGTVWFLVSLLGFLALTVAAILYVNTLKHVREEERACMEAIEAELAQRLADAQLVRDDERDAARAEARLEGELEERKLAAMRKDEAPAERKPSRFSLRPGRR